MNLTLAILMTSISVSFVILLQSIEILQITGRKEFKEIWSFNNLKLDLECGLPLPNSLIRFIFSESAFKVIVVFQLITACLGLYYLEPFIFLALFITNLIICIRFRGTFNGGSDMMTFVLLTGVLIAILSPEEKFQRLGLIYISIHAIYSYFKAGIIKLKGPDWRNGLALPAFLSRSLNLDVRNLGEWLKRKPSLSRLLCWGVLVFELAAILVIFMPSITHYYFLIAAVFHFFIYLAFGLNRFFWIWLTAWPAILYSLSTIRLIN